MPFSIWLVHSCYVDSTPTQRRHQSAQLVPVAAIDCSIFSQLQQQPSLFVQPLFGNFVVNCPALYPFCSYRVFATNASNANAVYRQSTCYSSHLGLNSQGHRNLDSIFQRVLISMWFVYAKWFEHWTIFDGTTAPQIWRVFSETHYRNASFWTVLMYTTVAFMWFLHFRTVYKHLTQTTFKLISYRFFVIAWFNRCVVWWSGLRGGRRWKRQWVGASILVKKSCMVESIPVYISKICLENP